MSHNPYFNRWFSAIHTQQGFKYEFSTVTILILIDGFLQYLSWLAEEIVHEGHNPYFNRWFSAIW